MNLILNAILIVGGIALLLLNPSILILVLLGNLAVSLFVLVVQFISSLLPNKYKERKRVSLKNAKFVSIHVPTYNEPPYIVKNTLKALSKLDYENYEVLVIDNNTKDKAIWQPVKEYCETLGPKFRFIHVDPLKGFKAGALNYLMKRVNPQTEFVAVIDADYIVKPDFIKKALQYFVDDKIGFVQFPQAFYNIGRGNLGVTLEYKHFFITYMNMSNYMGSLLTTGTLTVFRYDAIQDAGKFNTHALTEDAEIGLKLNLAGYQGVYVNDVVGEGLMPYDLDSYEKQKRRWSMGNAQIIKDNLFKILRTPIFNWKEKIAIFAQLTAWLNFCLLPIFAIFTVGIMGLFTNISRMSYDIILIVSLTTLFTYVLFKLISFVLIFRKENIGLISTLRAWLVHIGMQEVYSYALFLVLLSPNSEFIRTNKFLNMNSRSFPSGVVNEIILVTLSVVLAVHFYLVSDVIGFMAVTLAGILFSLIFYVAFEFKYTKKYSKYAFERLNIKADKL
ncbi:MAG: glycosyltransferase [Candidatus Doudnabacteria bacterium]|nr:glycosyltransferase [Candidatus Doudnabacteria bacterium]